MCLVRRGVKKDEVELGAKAHGRRRQMPTSGKNIQEKNLHEVCIQYVRTLDVTRRPRSV
jgi:hypothetical protein